MINNKCVLGFGTVKVLLMSERSSDEEKREIHIERRRKVPPIRAVRGQVKRVNDEKIVQRRHESKPADQKDDDIFSSKHESMQRDVSSLVNRINGLSPKVNQVDDNIKGVLSRINAVKAGGYFLPKDLEEQSNELADRWSKAVPEIMRYSSLQTNQLYQKQSFLESGIQRSISVNELTQHEAELNNLSRDIGLTENMLNSSIQEYQAQYNQVNKELLRAEDTARNLINTSIQWKNTEYPIYSTRVNDLTNNREGFLTLSNLRILFEEEKEEVIKKTLFFATEKRTTREVLLDQPIGSINSIDRGRVGLLKGVGLYIRFKPQTGLDELKIDTRSDDDEDIIHFYDLVVTGRTGDEADKPSTITPTVCPNCSAPFTDEILRGQTSIRCRYCGSVIKL